MQLLKAHTQQSSRTDLSSTSKENTIKIYSIEALLEEKILYKKYNRFRLLKLWANSSWDYES